MNIEGKVLSIDDEQRVPIILWEAFYINAFSEGEIPERTVNSIYSYFNCLVKTI